MKRFIYVLLVSSLIGCIALDRYITDSILDECANAQASNLREMVRISVVALSQKGSNDALAIAKQLGEQLELQTKVNKEMGILLGNAWKELEELRQSNKDLLEMFNKPDRGT